MMKVRKQEGKTVRAYRLGEPSEQMDAWMTQGLIRSDGDGRWRIRSREAEEGEAAADGDYVKMDSSGVPYPNTAEFFEQNHRHVGGDEYVQIPKTLDAWCIEEGMCPEIRFLMEHRGLVIDEADEQAYFRAPLWGDMLTAAKDAVIVFYSLSRDDAGAPVDADFNFVARDEFERIYEVLEA